MEGRERNWPATQIVRCRCVFGLEVRTHCSSPSVVVAHVIDGVGFRRSCTIRASGRHGGKDIPAWLFWCQQGTLGHRWSSGQVLTRVASRGSPWRRHNSSLGPDCTTPTTSAMGNCGATAVVGACLRDGDWGRDKVWWLFITEPTAQNKWQIPFRTLSNDRGFLVLWQSSCTGS
jgi:hypothetical protein